MALFGKPKPKFGNPYLDTQGPPIAGNDPMRKMDPAPGLGMVEAAQGKKPSVLPYLLAGAEDLVARQMGYQPQGVARLNAAQAEQQQSAAAAQADQLKRAQDLADWRYKQQWNRDNPMPANNDTLADYELINERLGPEAAKMFLENRANPPLYREGADGIYYRVETGQMPTAPVGTLRPYQPKGGPAGNGGGNFPQ